MNSVGTSNTEALSPNIVNMDVHIDIKIGELLPASTLSICIAEAPLSKLCYTGHMAQLRATYAMSNDLFGLIIMMIIG